LSVGPEAQADNGRTINTFQAVSMSSFIPLRAFLLSLPMTFALSLALPGAAAAGLPSAAPAQEETIPAYAPRPGRTRPLVAVVGENSGTELTDFVIPYSLLAQSGKADVLAVSVAPGPITMRPAALELVPQATVDRFDADHPDGADYVIVPAVVRKDEPRLLAWIREQRIKGATLVSICDGALVLANAGVLEGRRATAHWFTAPLRARQYPGTRWVANTRYVADGGIVSSAGISAAMPTSLRLVEAIAGHAAAASLAARYGIREWGSAHDSEAFVPRLGVNLMPYAVTNYVNDWFFRTEAIGVPLSGGVDDVALALSMDAWSRTGRSRAYAVADSATPVATRSGLVFIPQRVATDGQAPAPARMLPPLSLAPGVQVFDQVLADIAARYGRRTATGVAYDFEYQWK
jgi:putative intracellular protease/amidase